jgi:hypothetical protein
MPLAHAFATEKHAMKPAGTVPMVLLAALVLLPACSPLRVGQKIDHQKAKIDLASQAWRAARIRLHSMCPHVPKGVEEITEALKVDSANGCFARLAKDTYAPMADDWHWHWLPPYQVVVAVHDEELRKRMTPKLHDEYMFGLTRYLAEKADNDEITPEQFRHAFIAGWNWLQGKVHEESMLLQPNLLRADSADAAARDRISHVAGSLATVAMLALAVSADDKTYQPTPANCYAYPKSDRNYRVQCY